MKNWKTTLFGWLSAALIIGHKLITHQPVTFDDIVLAGSAAGIGTAAKDSNVTGGSVQQ